MRVDQTKLMLLSSELTELCDRFVPANEAEAGAMVGMFLMFGATIAAKIHRLPFSLPQIERLARAAQDGLNEAIKEEAG